MTDDHQLDAILAGDVAILGRKGAGKTFTAKGFVERLLDQKKRVCIIDPVDAWWGLRSSADGKAPGYPVVVFGGEHGDVQITEHSGNRLAEIVAGRNLPCIITLAEFTMGERHRFMQAFLATLHAKNRRPLHLIVDEADEVAPQNPMPETKRVLHEIDRIVRRGRIRGFRVMLITQRPAVLHKNVLSQASTLIAMRLMANQDRDAINAWVEAHADRVKAREVIDSLPKLAPGEGWIWSPEIGLLERRRFPMIRTFDSSRTPDDGEAIPEPTTLTDVDAGELRALMEAEEPKPAAGGDSVVAQRQREQIVALTEHGEALSRLLATRTSERDAALATLAAIRDLAGPAAATPQSEPVAAPPPRQREVVPLAEARRRHVAAAPMAASAADRKVSGPQQRILDALGWWSSVGITDPTRVQIAVVAGYSPDGGAFQNPLGGLRSAGLIDYDAPGTATLTDAGAALAARPPSAPTNAELHDKIMAILDGPRRRILEPLLKAYPDALSREDLAAAAGYQPTGGAFQNPLGALRSLGLVDYPARGVVVAMPVLFIGGRV